ncbi:hypothetical protein VOLCADRAFT_102852 [Volvox carteri f. nagariensis]|uniref:Uncharacterized protein n=1 Tax=Volvox carteri f. nagariensis TaxID=3068 RepID=D8TIH6_VOLCA|nr:uncharacterized protein VOLCADRAFT_102852 [Volvox carteri f. nagariensis]EFJ52892.1 hypothetical protein VOLCADRAFT_102852 [Volvox carteri f. nagariensis]|eukprot:XP_002945897.1 hypothetical protein VOLCADRAFT_102852 [Volvox carteri f. nagariensis]
MEPLSTFFRINPALLFQNVTTPRSQTSSSISSPSFADHQTGLKVYSESPASLTSAHQDNPLFEGFPVLPASKRKAAVSGDAHGTKNTAVPGDSPKLEEQLHHLLEVLQQALELHSADGLPDDVAPRLADELQAVARRLRDKERELPVERQLRAKVQLALTGAEATIRKLRATPRRRTSANGSGVDWRSNEAASSPTLAAHTNSRFSAGTTLVAEGNTRGGIERDSVCRQLLQSPSSSMSPLSWTGPSFVTGGTPMCVVDDASMASPKELPTDQNGSTCSQLASVAGSSHGQIKIPTGIPRLRQLTSTSSEAATSSSFHPPLYNWMKAVLASTTKQNQPMLLHGNGSVGSDAGTRGVEDGSEAQSPGMGGAVHDSLASVVRAALSNKRTPPLIYGSPLYRRIQRLLAEQRSPIPLRNTSAPGGVMQQSLYSVEPSPIGGRRRGWETGATAPASSRPVWDQEVDTDSASASNRSSDTSSSCTTPTMTMRDDIAALPFDSSVSPFGPTLRERYAARTNTVASATASIQYPSATAASAAFDATGLSGGLPRPAREPEREAAELVAELGLDLQLAPFTVENITNLEVLAHAERWIRGQFIAANKVLEANRERTLEDERCSGSAGCSNDLDSSAQAQVEMVIQTEPAYRLSAGEHVLQCSASTSAPSFSAAAVNPTPIWPPKPKGRAAPGGVRVQQSSQERLGVPRTRGDQAPNHTPLTATLLGHSRPHEIAEVKSGGSSMSFSGNNPSAGGTVVGPSMANGHVPPAPRGPQGSADSFTPRTDESAEITAEVIFTPGNAQLGAKGYTEKRMMVPFRLDSATRSECETEEGDGSAKTLSSISSVSIIGSEPANATDLGADAARRPARRSESQSAGGGLQQATGRKGGTSKPQLSKYLCSFLTTLLPCTNGSVAS